MKILIMGLPGSGKTTLAIELAKKLNAVHWNADSVRQNINTHLGFSEDDRIEQSRRMGWLCDQVVSAGQIAIADFVCPTMKTRAIFGPCDFVIWMDTIQESRFEDTNKLFVPPAKYNFRVYTFNAHYWAYDIHDQIMKRQKYVE